MEDNTTADQQPSRSARRGRAGPAMNRSTFFKASAGALLGAGLVGGGATWATSKNGEALLSNASAPPGSKAPAFKVTKIGDLTGPGLTDKFKMAATDLGIPAVNPEGRVLWIFGDTYEHAKAAVEEDNWRSPVGLYSDTKGLEALNGGVKWAEAVGGDSARQLWPYAHNNPEFTTVLPSDVITIGNTMYLHVMVNKGLMNVIRTEIWKSEDNGSTWTHTGATFDANFHGNQADPNPFQLITWGLGDNDWVYIYSTEFSRKRPMYLHRVHKDNITDPNAYEPFGAPDGKNWAWGNNPTPVLKGAFGEMSLRPMGEKWVLSWFNAGDGRIEAMVMDTPDSDLEKAHRKPLIYSGEWGKEDDTHVAQLYGGYIIPGSTMDELHLSVSQWNTQKDENGQPKNWPYRVMQFRAQGWAN